MQSAQVKGDPTNKDARKEAYDLLREIEEDFFVEPELAQELEHARAEARRGGGISHEDLVKELGLTED